MFSYNTNSRLFSTPKLVAHVDKLAKRVFSYAINISWHQTMVYLSGIHYRQYVMHLIQSTSTLGFIYALPISHSPSVNRVFSEACNIYLRTIMTHDMTYIVVSSILFWYGCFGRFLWSNHDTGFLPFLFFLFLFLFSFSSF